MSTQICEHKERIFRICISQTLLSFGASVGSLGCGNGTKVDMEGLARQAVPATDAHLPCYIHTYIRNAQITRDGVRTICRVK